jgi:hypothetical protein
VHFLISCIPSRPLKHPARPPPITVSRLALNVHHSPTHPECSLAMCSLFCLCTTGGSKTCTLPQHSDALLRRAQPSDPLSSAHHPGAIQPPMVRRPSSQRAAHPFCECLSITHIPVHCTHPFSRSYLLGTPPPTPFAPIHSVSCSQWHASDFQPSYRVADLFVKRSKLLLQMQTCGYRLQYVLPRVNCQGPQLQRLAFCRVL